jgi:hypothetical protein
MSGARLIHLDFALPVRRSRTAGVLLCATGIAAAVAVGIVFQGEIAARSRLDAELEALTQTRHSAVPPTTKSGEESEAVKAARALSIPWTRLLAELESASHDMGSQVALLQVEPDADKRLLRITAEVRSLPDALQYLQRLQKSPMLRYPMLESHERRKDDPEHPIRIKLAAEWRP